MTKAANESPQNAVGLVAVERRVKAQVHALHSIAIVLREFAHVHDKYAQDYAKLSLGAAPSNVGICLPLQRVTQELDKAVSAVTQAHVALALELNSVVVAPLEAFEKQQRHQTKQLVGEIEEALQREKGLHSTLMGMIETYKTSQDVEMDPVDNNQDTDVTTAIVDAKTIKVKRDREREITRQRLVELDLTEEQQGAIVQEQLRRCFDAIGRYTTRVLIDVGEVLTTLVLLTSSQRMEMETMTLDEAMQLCRLHIDATGWMSTLFTQIIPIEETMIKRLQALTKGHSVHAVTTVFGSSSTSTTSRAANEFTTLWELVQSHKQLTANLADPIGRTLRFSKQKQETIQKELLESIEDIQNAIQMARNKVKAKESKLLQLMQQEMQQRQEPQAVLGTTGMDAILSSSSFGFRQAVMSWTKQMSSPKKPLLFKSKSVNSVGVFMAQEASLAPKSSVFPIAVMAEKSPRRKALEDDLTEARETVQILEKSEEMQRQEMAKTLENTALIGVKTMELMVTDYLKNITKAMNLAATAMAKCSERLEKPVDRIAYFQTIRFFDDQDLSDVDFLKRPGDDENNPVPEANASETESEDPGELVGSSTSTSRTNTVEIQSAVRATCSLPVENAGKLQRGTLLTELTKVLENKHVRTTTQEIVDLGRRVVTIVWKGLNALLQSMERSPEQWQAALVILILVSLFSFVRRLDRLDNGWSQLAELQQENARHLQQLVAMMAET